MDTALEQHPAEAPANGPRHVTIIGGGIAGLSAAWHLRRAADQAGIPLNYTLLERSGRWGGKIRTEYVEHENGRFTIEAGPDSFLTQKPWALEMALALGMDERLLGTNDDRRQVFVVNRGKLTPLPDGVFLIVPTRFKPFALSPLISPLGKLRMGLELFIPKRRDDSDESLADFVRRRLGAEVLDKLAEPLMSGIYNAEAENQSLLATFPRFRTLEQQHGSLIRGMLASRRNGASSHKPAQKPRYSTFTSFRDGMQELVDTLVPALDGDLRLNTGVERIDRRADSGYRLALADGTTLDTDAVIVTTPAYTAADLLRPLAPGAADLLDSVRYVGTGTISLAYSEADLPKPLSGFGLVIPRSENRPINAVTHSSVKFDHRAPEGTVLLRVFFGGSRNPQTMDYDDEAILKLARDEVRTLLGIEAEPLLHRIYRHQRANPQYDVGHLERVAAIEAALPAGLFVTGSPYRGVGVPDCVHQSQDLASRVLADLSVEAGTRASTT